VAGVTSGSIYALVGLGFTVIYSVTGIINFAQGEFVMLGGMISYIILDSMGLPTAPALLLTIITVAAIGAVLYLLAIRSARKASVVSLIIITIGASVFIRGVAGEIWTKDYVRPPYFSGDQSISFLGAYIQPQALWIIGVTIAAMVVLHVFLTYTVMGKALRACAINRAAAGLVGIDARVMALISFSLAAAFGALGGAVVAPLTTTSYSVGVMMGLKGFVAAAIGGFRSPVAAFVGGITIGVVESLAVRIGWGPFSSAYKDAIALVVLLLILLVRSGRLAAEERAG
jgi:branched-chain amino acid transport system permease protein